MDKKADFAHELRKYSRRMHVRDARATFLFSKVYCRKRGQSSPGFTMIELLIVVAILPIATLAMVGLISSAGTNRMQMEGRMDAEEASARTLSLWRQDVGAASSVLVSQDGRLMTINRIDPEGKAYAVTYTVAGKGSLIRVVQKTDSPAGSVPRTLVERASGLQFSKEGGAYQIRWTTEFSDGLHVWRWSKSGFATPLLAGEA